MGVPRFQLLSIVLIIAENVKRGLIMILSRTIPVKVPSAKVVTVKTVLIIGLVLFPLFAVQSVTVYFLAAIVCFFTVRAKSVVSFELALNVNQSILIIQKGVILAVRPSVLLVRRWYR